MEVKVTPTNQDRRVSQAVMYGGRDSHTSKLMGVILIPQVFVGVVIMIIGGIVHGLIFTSPFSCVSWRLAYLRRTLSPSMDPSTPPP